MQNIGLIGAAVMGSNLALNMANHGYSVAVYSRTAEHVRHFIEGAAKGKDIIGCYSLEELLANIEKPRRILLMIKAGAPVDAMIDRLLPMLEPGDISSMAATATSRTPRGAGKRWKRPAASTSAWASPAAKKARSTARA